jgi:methionyl aminopeptidase
VVKSSATLKISFLKSSSLVLLLVQKSGAKSSFLTVPGYRYTTCINVNSGVVHGLPTKTPLKEGDNLTIDMGILFQGFHTDSAFAMGVGQITKQKQQFLEVGRKTLTQAIQATKPGNRLGHISKSIEDNIKKASYSPIIDLTGHGIGRQLHEPPNIHCFLKGKISQTPHLKPGMVLAIEVIYAAGSPKLVLDNDGWTISTKDGKMAAVFEHTVVITQDGHQILT